MNAGFPDRVDPDPLESAEKSPFQLKPFANKKRFLSRFSRGAFQILVIFFLYTVLQVIAVRFVHPPFTPLMLYRQIQTGCLAYIWRPLNQISPRLQQAVIASEDQNFLNHSGFDWDQIQRAIDENQRRKRPRGASTISMQVARNVFLWQGGGYFRKILEAYYTFLIELIWSKHRILEIYLNVAEWGNGIFGAEACSQANFKTPAAKISKTQAALMAAILPSPRKYSASNPGPFVKSRQTEILAQMDYFKPFGQDE